MCIIFHEKQYDMLNVRAFAMNTQHQQIYMLIGAYFNANMHIPW